MTRIYGGQIPTIWDTLAGKPRNCPAVRPGQGLSGKMQAAGAHVLPTCSVNRELLALQPPVCMHSNTEQLHLCLKPPDLWVYYICIYIYVYMYIHTHILGSVCLQAHKHLSTANTHVTQLHSGRLQVSYCWHGKACLKIKWLSMVFWRMREQMQEGWSISLLNTLCKSVLIVCCCF